VLARIPPLHADELLYSWVARVGVRAYLRYRQDLVQLIWGDDHHRSSVDLPVRLGIVADQAEGILGDAQNVLWKATLFPLYAPFVPLERRQEVAEAMTTREAGKGSKVKGLTSLRLRTPPSLRYCPECWKRDDKREIERYWRRTHQCPGAFVCPWHERALFYSDASWASRERVQEFVPAAQVREGRGRRIPVRDRDVQVCLNVAKSCRWLLNVNEKCPGPVRLTGAYRTALREHDLVRPSGRICPEFGDFVSRKVGPAMMKTASRSLGWAKDWPQQMLLPSRSSRTCYSPLQHLLLMSALGHTAENFFAAMAKPSLLEMTLGRVQKQPVKARVPKPPSVCRLRASEIEAWWNDPKVSVTEMGRRLGVAPGTVTLFASRTGLSFPRKGLLGNTWSKFAEPVPRDVVSIRDGHRKAFLDYRCRYPAMSQTDLIRAGKPGLRWLQKHDQEWLKGHRNVETRKGGSPGIDWEVRDEEYARRAPKIVSELLRKGKPVNYSAVGRALGISLVNIHPRLPLTSRTLLQIRAQVR